MSRSTEATISSTGPAVLSTSSAPDSNARAWRFRVRVLRSASVGSLFVRSISSFPPPSGRSRSTTTQASSWPASSKTRSASASDPA